MNELPVVTGLLVCDLVITDADTRNTSFINRFTTRRVNEFPTLPQRLVVAAALVDGFGRVPLVLEVEPLDGTGPIRTIAAEVEFVDRLEEVLFVVEFTDLEFPQSGYYQLSLLAAGEPLARKRIQILPADGVSL